MRIGLIDIQGFHILGGFHPKEMTIEIGSQRYDFLFKAPINYNQLNVSDKKTVIFYDQNV